MELIFATNNNNKALEINSMTGNLWRIRSLSDIGFYEEVPETGNTLEENAIQKSRYIYDALGKECFADDTGLEIESLDGAPGVYSARYAGPEKDSMQNIQKVLEKMEGVQNRKARFRTVIALIMKGELKLFEGTVNGTILETLRGEKGFGYDPVFKPEGYDLSFAEMSLSQKNKISHRGLAVNRLVDYLNSIKNL